MDIVLRVKRNMNIVLLLEVKSLEEYDPHGDGTANIRYGDYVHNFTTVPL